MEQPTRRHSLLAFIALKYLGLRPDHYRDGFELQPVLGPLPEPPKVGIGPIEPPPLWFPTDAPRP